MEPAGEEARWWRQLRCDKPHSNRPLAMTQQHAVRLGTHCGGRWEAQHGAEAGPGEGEEGKRGAKWRRGPGTGEARAGEGGEAGPGEERAGAVGAGPGGKAGPGG